MVLIHSMCNMLVRLDGKFNMRKKHSPIRHYLLIAILLTVVVSPAFASNEDDGFTIVVNVAVFIAIIGLFFFIFFYIVRASTLKASLAQEQVNAVAKFISGAHDKMVEIIKNHVPTLAVKYRQLIIQDAYGVVDVSPFIKEVDYFIEKVLCADQDVRSYLGGVDSGNIDAVYSAITAQQNAINEKHSKGVEAKSELGKVKTEWDRIINRSTQRTEDAKKIIYKLVSEYRINQIENQEGQAVDVESLDPIQFEHYCADLLNSTGWNARVTQASGDQGIDVIAQHGNVKAVFQCKKYSQPVGNAAVQEIIAGKAFEQAHVAAVVTNATYTTSAKQLASTTGVHLLHFSEVPQFAEKLGLVESV